MSDPAPEKPAASPPPANTPDKNKPPRRKPLLEDKDTAAPPAAKPIITGVPKPRPAPARRGGPGWPHIIGISIGQILILGLLIRLLMPAENPAPPPAASAAVPPPVTAGASAIESALEKARAEIRNLQTRLDAESQDKQRTQARLQELADRLALVIQQGGHAGASQSGSASATAAQVASVLPTVTPATAELILIKERNRLSSYADSAIADGSRADLESLVKAMLDPGLQNLSHAAQAEFKRVQAWYEIATSMDPGYTLPVQDLFKDSPATREADLTPAQLHTLLLDLQKPWEARLRAAFLLRSSNDPGTTPLLLKALKEDPMLDVAKQAQISFENRVGRRFRIFDIPAIEAWWQAQNPSGSQ